MLSSLSEKEEVAMKVLWSSKKPLSASEIGAEIGTDWAKKSIQNIIRKLEEKEFIRVAEITKIGKTYGRLFSPCISAEDYALMQFNRFYQKDKTVPFILSALIGNRESKKDLSKKLKAIIEEYEEE